MHNHHNHTNFSSSSSANTMAWHFEERKRIVEFFKEKNALSSATAIEVTSVDWATLGVNPQLSITLLGNNFEYIVKTESGKYYLDEKLLTQRLQTEGKGAKASIKFFKIFAIVVAVIFALSSCIGVVLFLLSILSTAGFAGLGFAFLNK